MVTPASKEIILFAQHEKERSWYIVVDKKNQPESRGIEYTRRYKEGDCEIRDASRQKEIGSI
jgi:hypothetical protein